MTKKTFLRREAKRHSKLGRKRKKKQVWRKPKGRDNKMREKRKGYPVVVKVGYKKDKKKKSEIIIKNLKDFGKINKKDRILLGKVGKKKKIEISKKAKEMKISFENFNTNKFLKSIKKSGGKNESK